MATTFDFERPANAYGDISTTTACAVKQREHDELEQQLRDYLSRGGVVEVVPFGRSGTIDGLFGGIAKHLNKKQRANQAKLYDDPPTDESEE